MSLKQPRTLKTVIVYCGSLPHVVALSEHLHTKLVHSGWRDQTLFFVGANLANFVRSCRGMSRYKEMDISRKIKLIGSLAKKNPLLTEYMVK